MKLEQFFEKYDEISRLIEKRFDQYKPLDPDIHMDADLTSWIYECGEIEIIWNAYWNYGGHERGTFYMPLEWIEMSEDEWQTFLEDFKRKQEKEKRRKELQERRQKLKHEREQYEKLKSKFENEEN